MRSPAPTGPVRPPIATGSAEAGGASQSWDCRGVCVPVPDLTPDSSWNSTHTSGTQSRVFLWFWAKDGSGHRAAGVRPLLEGRPPRLGAPLGRRG